MSAHKKNARTRLAAVVAGVVVAVGAVVVAPSPAYAEACPTPGCGGKVVNQSSRQINIENCGGDGDRVVTNGLTPCARNGWSQNKYNAGWFLSSGQNSTSKGKYYYDVDYVQMPAGCTTYGYISGPTNFVHNRHGLSALWFRIYGQNQVVIQSVVC